MHDGSRPLAPRIHPRCVHRGCQGVFLELSCSHHDHGPIWRPGQPSKEGPSNALVMEHGTALGCWRCSSSLLLGTTCTSAALLVLPSHSSETLSMRLAIGTSAAAALPLLSQAPPAHGAWQRPRLPVPAQVLQQQCFETRWAYAALVAQMLEQYLYVGASIHAVAVCHTELSCCVK